MSGLYLGLLTQLVAEMWKNDNNLSINVVHFFALKTLSMLSLSVG